MYNVYDDKYNHEEIKVNKRHSVVVQTKISYYKNGLQAEQAHTPM